MKWKIPPKPKPPKFGDRRTRRKFAWWPCFSNHDYHWHWLERVTVHETFEYVGGIEIWVSDPPYA